MTKEQLEALKEYIRAFVNNANYSGDGLSEAIALHEAEKELNTLFLIGERIDTMIKYISCKDGMCGATDCPKCSPHYFKSGINVNDIEEDGDETEQQEDEQLSREEARQQWIEQKAQIANDDKVGSNIERLLERHPTVEFKENE